MNGVNILLVHQIGSSASQMKPLEDALKEQGITSITRLQLQGHGTKPSALRHVRSVNEWVKQVLQETKELQKPLVFIGMGSGGLLGLLTNHVNKYSHIHLINTSLFLSWQQKYLLKILNNPERLIKTGKQIKEALELNYDFYQAAPEKIFHFIAQMKKTIQINSRTHLLNTPITFHVSRNNQIKPFNAKKTRKLLPNAQITYYNTKEHNLIPNYSKALVKKILQDLKKQEITVNT